MPFLLGVRKETKQAKLRCPVGGVRCLSERGGGALKRCTPGQGMAAISLMGLTTLMQLWGKSACLCHTVLFLCFRAPCWLPVRTPKQCFTPFCSIWLLDLCEDVDCPWCAGGWAQAEGRDAGGEKCWCFSGFDLSDFCFSCPARIRRVKLISRSVWE